MKRKIPVLALLLLLAFLSGCLPAQKTPHTATYLTVFDTVTTVKGFGSQAEFDRQAQQLYDQLLRYHRLFDIYNDYEGINNLKTVNDRAGQAPVTVDPAIIRLLLDCKAYYELTDGRVNAAMGSVLKLWHDARTAPGEPRLPDPEALEAAAAHTDFSRVLIDEAASTVFITDPELSLDVGAIAKGWAAQRVAEQAPAGLLLSVGGNVCVTGPKPGGEPWIIGIQSPDTDAFLHTLSIDGGSVVTSGDYQRGYTVDGKLYHHIIDPDTRMPGEYWRSVTVVCEDSALADALSTALFLLPHEAGEALALRCGAQALWLAPDGTEYQTSGFQKLLTS